MMNYSSTLPMNENAQFQKPLKYKKNRSKSLIQQHNKSALSCDNKSVHSNGTSIIDKIKGLFSSKSNHPTEKIHSAKLKINKKSDRKEEDYKNLNEFPPIANQYTEWQPVYRETCKIKLPVEEGSTKISLPQDIVEDWVHNQNNLSTELGTSGIKNKQDNEQMSSQSNCFSNKKSQQNSCASNNEEPYSKFKCYYNYYLVDEYLESLIESQNKNLDTTGLDEEGQLYDNVGLNVKPIIVSKQRLENGIPYDPSNLIN